MSSSDSEMFDPAEDCPWRSPREIFASFGYHPLSPDDLDDRSVSGRLWELFYAAAARRIYFCFTNHLDDRSLYSLLWNEWLDEPTADIPLEAETNTNVMISEFPACGMTAEEIYSRYYDDDAESSLTEREEPPHDRDRHLPTAPFPPEAHAGWLPGDDEPSEEVDEDEPSEALIEKLEAMEPENWTPPAKELAEANIPLMPPDEITDEAMPPILWELLHNLSIRGFYVSHTNHLSDRDLYRELWHHGLKNPAHLPGRNPRGGWFHDVLGSWGDDEMQLWLRYYASDEERAKHAKEWPKDNIPPKEKTISNRDWRLPKGPFG